MGPPGGRCSAGWTDWICPSLSEWEILGCCIMFRPTLREAARRGFVKLWSKPTWSGLAAFLVGNALIASCNSESEKSKPRPSLKAVCFKPALINLSFMVCSFSPPDRPSLQGRSCDGCSAKSPATNGTSGTSPRWPTLPSSSSSLRTDAAQLCDSCSRTPVPANPTREYVGEEGREEIPHTCSCPANNL